MAFAAATLALIASLDALLCAKTAASVTGARVPGNRVLWLLGRDPRLMELLSKEGGKIVTFELEGPNTSRPRAALSQSLKRPAFPLNDVGRPEYSRRRVWPRPRIRDDVMAQVRLSRDLTESVGRFLRVAHRPSPCGIGGVPVP